MILNLESFVAELRITEGTASRPASAAAASSTAKYHEAVAKNREKLQSALERSRKKHREMEDALFGRKTKASG